MNRGKIPAARLSGFLSVWAVILFTLAAAVYGTAGDGGLLAAKMLQYAPPETTGLPETEYPGMARMIAGYLTEKEDTFQYTFSDPEGRTYVCFQSHEADHMADCRGLICLAGRLRTVFGGVCLFLAAAGMIFRRRAAFAGGMLSGLYAAGFVITGILIWALADFDGLFTAFHRAAFTNEGWLLNPRTDLLIRLMPVNFFVALGAGIMIRAVLAGLVTAGAAVLLRFRKGKTGTAEISEAGRTKNGGT